MRNSIFKTAVLCFLVGISSCVCAANKDAKSDKEGKVIHINNAEFNQKVADVNANEWKYLGDKPCILDFYATWCGPCRMISPYLDELANEYKGQIYIYKIDVDKERELGRMFGATSIPLLVFIPQDGQAQMARGAMSKNELKNAIETVLLKKQK
ncbi:MAG: thioredoxin [Paludibacteraceae bacterium]|nr:thioredoxin [Paludibacteraceae bacterium]